MWIVITAPRGLSLCLLEIISQVDFKAPNAFD